MVEPIKLKIRPGLYRQGPEYEAAGRWYDNQYWRFVDGVIKPMKGWATGLAGTLSGTPLAAHAWLDNDELPFAAFGTTTKLYIHDGTTLNDITPSGFTSTTVWTLDNFGEVLVACDGTNIYEFTPGAGGDATAVTGAPTASSIFVTEEKFLIALGSGGDPRQFAWPDQATLTTWTATAINQAGDLPLHSVGKLVSGMRIRGGALMFTTEGVQRLDYIGPPDVYGTENVGQGCGIIGTHAKVSVDAIAYWMGRGQFYRYGGYVEPLPSDVSDDVFRNINTTHQSKCWAEHYPEAGEVWFYYPRGLATTCSHAAIYNYREGHWNHTPMARTCGFGPDVFGWPLRATSAGAMLKHETGWAYDSEVRKLISGPLEIGTGGKLMEIDEIIPSELTQGDVEVYLHLRDYPNATETTVGPFAAADRMSILKTARQIRVELRMASGKEDARIGPWRATVRARGRY